MSNRFVSSMLRWMAVGGPSAALVSAVFAGPVPSILAAQNSASDTRPTVAVMYFDNGALVQHADYDPFSKGIADMLITSLAQNDRIRVVERDQLQQLLKEQNLATTTHVDPATAARIGKLLGARHMIFGGFVIDMHQNMRLDARAVNTETSQVEHVETVSDKADNLLPMVNQLADKLNSGLKLPAITASRTPPAVPSATSETTSAKGAKTTAAPVHRWQALLEYSRALVEEDNGNTTQAVSLYQQFLDATPPDFATAQRSQAEDKIRKLAPATGGD
jgi:curli biogenesis system outer membrane secretion channel CsgG